MRWGSRVTSALVIAATGALVAVSCASPQSAPRSSLDPPVTEDEPRGRLLIGVESIDQETAVLDIETGEAQALPDGLVALDLSEDGSKVLASPLLHEPSGLGYALELVSVDVRTGAREVLVRSDSLGSLDGGSWSPDGLRIAYTQYADRHETASLIAQDKVPQSTLCIRTFQGGEPQCFPEVGSVYTFDWSADSERLLVGGTGGEPMRVVDVTTGEASGVVSAQDPDVLAVMRKEAGVEVSAVQFIGPAWSPSGRYIGTRAMAGQTVPMIFRSDGALVAWGRSNPEFRPLGWSPTRDVLAYSVGVNGESSPKPAVHLLDAVSGEDQLLLPTAGESAPMVFDLDWSPGGRWLALGDMDLVRLVDTTGAEESRRIRPFGGLPGAVIDWIA
jgi:WD40 repeat protein